jgi:hypothetical protein
MIKSRVTYGAKRILLHVKTYGAMSLYQKVGSKIRARIASILHGSIEAAPVFSRQLNDAKLDSTLYSYILNEKPTTILCPEGKRITWIVPEYGPSSGGHRTIFRHISNLHKLGIASTLVVLEVGHSFTTDKAYQNLPKDLDLSGLVIKMARNADSIDGTLIVTSWHTAYWARRLAEDCLYGAYYFIQDYESLFYPSGSLSLLASQTYHMPYRHIYASSWLADVVPSKASCDKRIVNLGVDVSEFFASDSVVERRVSRIRNNDIVNVGVYYRPVTARRMEEHLYLLLEYASKQELGVKLHFFGWEWAKHDWPTRSKWHENHGVVAHHELNDLLERLDCCVLLGSTNVSLMPLETIAAGLPTFVNEGGNNSCLLAGLPIYISSVPDEGFKRFSDCIADRELLVSKIRSGLTEVKGLSWEKRSLELYDILFDGEQTVTTGSGD